MPVKDGDFPGPAPEVIYHRRSLSRWEMTLREALALETGQLSTTVLDLLRAPRGHIWPYQVRS